MTKKRVATIKKIFTFFGGLLVGFVNGFLGAGGGMIVVPLLRLLNKEDQKISHATAILVLLPISLISAIAYLINKNVQVNIIAITACGTFVGGLIGTFLLCKLRGKVIGYIFTIIMAISGIMMIIKS